VTLPVLSAFTTKVNQVIQDAGGNLDSTAVLAFIAEAVKSYSQLRPLVKVVQTTGDAGYDYDLPLDWEDGFSAIQSIEYPADQQIPVILDPSRYQLYQKIVVNVSSTVLRFLVDRPKTTETFLMLYTIRHSLDESAGTIPEADKEAVSNLAGALCCFALARALDEEVGGSTIGGADQTWRSIVRYQEQGQNLINLYNKHMGISRDVLPAYVSGSMTSSPSWGPGWTTNRRS
jgi:hypothetical protein